MRKSIYIYFLLIFLLGISFFEQLYPQNYSSYRVGLNFGLNYNTVGMGYQNFLSDGTANWLTYYGNDGSAIAPYFGMNAEYVSENWWGISLRLAYDSRNVVVNDESVIKYGRDPEFDITANYLSIEPALRIKQHLIPDLYFLVGPLFSFNLNAKYDYKSQKSNTNYELINQNISNINSFVYGLNIGLNYDIKIAEYNNKNDIFISPFFDISYIANQRKPDFIENQDQVNDVWSTFTMRFGFKGMLEFSKDEQSDREISFSYLGLTLPANGEVIQRKVDEHFPLINSVFFDSGSQEIPSRYIKLIKFDARNFNENDILTTNKNSKNFELPRTEQQMLIYYNLLNIYAKRMILDSTVKLTLIGSSPIENDGDVLAYKIKSYFVEIMGIDPTRITTEKRILPKIPSGSSVTSSDDKPLADIENRRVEFVFNKEEIYKPVIVRITDEFPVDSDLEFNIFDDVKFDNWSITINGEGRSKTYGPFYERVESINPVELMRGLQKGRYNAKVVLNTPDGKTIIDDSEFELVKRIEETTGIRYTLLFNYGQSDAIKVYEKNLRNDIAPLIKEGYQLIVHGRTDNIGSDRTNKILSVQRAKEVKTIFDEEIRKVGKRINTKAIGYGEESMSSTFGNNLPEGRFYNRNVSIDIIPLRK